jgi:hypothetical protein
MSKIIQPDKQRGVATLDSCIRSALMDIDAGMEMYEKFKNWAIEGYRSLHFDLVQEIKTVELPLTAWKAIIWPDDYVDFVMIGVRVKGGQVRVFTNNESLALYFDDKEPDGNPDQQPTDDPTYSPTDITSTVNQRLWFWNNMDGNGSDRGGLFGLAVGHSDGYYKINRERRETQFNPAIAIDTKIYLEYISDGIDPCQQTVVNIYAATLLKLYIHWQRHEFSRSSNGMEKERSKRQYWDEYSRVQSRLNPLTVADILEVARESYHMAPVI